MWPLPRKKKYKKNGTNNILLRNPYCTCLQYMYYVPLVGSYSRHIALILTLTHTQNTTKALQAHFFFSCIFSLYENAWVVDVHRVKKQKRKKRNIRIYNTAVDKRLVCLCVCVISVDHSRLSQLCTIVCVSPAMQCRALRPECLIDKKCICNVA